MSPHQGDAPGGPDLLIERFSSSLERIIRLVNLIITSEEAPTG